MTTITNTTNTKINNAIRILVTSVDSFPQLQSKSWPTQAYKFSTDIRSRYLYKASGPLHLTT